MVEPDQAVIAALRSVLGDEAVSCDPGEMLAYECDGLPIAKGLPRAVVFPVDTAGVVSCVRLLARHGIPVVPRGSGTGLAGGGVAFDRDVVISTTRMNRIESIDLENRVAVVQAGVRNKALSDAVSALGTPLDPSGSSGSLRFAPDPSSAAVSTIGGNAATNAGGINTVKHGVTCHHILGLELVLPDGTVVTSAGGTVRDGFGGDLAALVCGSEGTLGLITRLWCRLTPAPSAFRTISAVFASTRDACEAVSEVVASGIVPTSMEMLDGRMIRVVEEAFAYGFDADAQAMLLVEIEGIDSSLDRQLAGVVDICTAHGARDIRRCADAARRDELWQARKRAFGAIGRISRSYCTQDACVPLSRLAEAVETITNIGATFGLQVSNVFHAGDGNVHPVLLFNEDDPQDVQRVLAASAEILAYCISIGGTITGEHGVGVEKVHLMSKMFNGDTIAVFDKIKRVFDSRRLFNDGKLIPSDRLDIQLVKPPTTNTPGGAG